MFKRIRAATIMLLAVLLLLLSPVCAFAAGQEQYDEAQLKETAYAMLMTTINVCADEAAYDNMLAFRDEELDYRLASSGYPITAADFKSLLTAWKSAEEECGIFTGTEELQQILEDFSLEKETRGIALTGEMPFADRNANVTISFKYDGSMQALTVGGIYTTSEILKKAGLNTLIGMGTVFVVLIVISLLISTFRFIPAMRERFEKKETEEAQEIQAAEPAAQTITHANVKESPAEPLKIPDGAVVHVTVKESQVTYVTVREVGK